MTWRNQSINQSVTFCIVHHLFQDTIYYLHACRQNTLNHRNEKSKSLRYKSMWSLSKFNSLIIRIERKKLPLCLAINDLSKLLYVHFTILKFIVKNFKCNKNAIKLGFVIDHSVYYYPFNTWRRHHILVYNGLIALGNLCFYKNKWHNWNPPTVLNTHSIYNVKLSLYN